MGVDEVSGYVRMAALFAGGHPHSHLKRPTSTEPFPSSLSTRDAINQERESERHKCPTVGTKTSVLFGF